MHHIVKELQGAYRDSLLKDRAKQAWSEPRVIFELRSYLTLCFPVTIEAKIDRLLSGAAAKSEPGHKATTEINLKSSQ